jgi:acetoacetyl-CoA synthetase
MVNSGVKAGDKVAVVMSNSANAIVLCLATLAIGAVWASASPDMGVQAIVDRYDQIKPSIIFAEDAYVYAGKKIMLGGNIASWSRTLKSNNPNLRDVITVPYFDTAVGTSHGVSWKDFVRRGTGLELSFFQLPFSHPAFILFSSGTVRHQWTYASHHLPYFDSLTVLL